MTKQTKYYHLTTYTQPVYKLQVCYNDDFEDAILLEESTDPWNRLMQIALHEIKSADAINQRTKMHIDINTQTICIEYMDDDICTTYFISPIHTF